jgi:hypothetical protein
VKTLQGGTYFLRKHKHLQESTLGALITILSKHGIVEADLNYLKWLKSKRDFFIHRYFQAGVWPGDLQEDQIDRACRTLAALDVVFQRGAHRMMSILGRAGLMKLEIIPGGGILAFNPDLFEDWNKI